MTEAKIQAPQVVLKPKPVLSPRIQLGLCCLNTLLREQGTFCSRKPIIRTVKERGRQVLVEAATANCQDLLKMIRWNHENGIKVFRMSSELFPHHDNPHSDVPRIDLGEYRDVLKEAGDLAKQYGQRVTFHPGQYNVLGTPRQVAFDNTILNLGMHAQILDLMETDKHSVMVIHGGGTYGDKDATKARWVKHYLELPEYIRRRLVLENCEKSFSVIDCLDVSRLCGVPVVFDNHHFDCYKILHPGESFLGAAEYMGPVLDTWRQAGIKPKFHISSQAYGGKVGKHAEFITEIPGYYLDIPDKFDVDIDIMVEAKLKEQAIFRLWRDYHFVPKV